MKRFFIIILIFGFLFSFRLPKAEARDFNPGNLIDDSSFQNNSSMTAADIQNFLASKGSYLAGYSENGRSAAQIIYDAAHGGGNASGTVTGTPYNIISKISPRVILVTLQKEQSLITSSSPGDSAIKHAMGYGCPDGGGCDPKYEGFTNQVEYASWQLQWNYERATKGYSDYQVGQTMGFSNTLSPYNPPPTQDVTFANAATVSFYRYTPHVYNGNYNFWKLYYTWFQPYASTYYNQNVFPTIGPGQSYNFVVQFRNNGETTWTQDVVRLGTARDRDHAPGFIREDIVNNNYSGWIVPNRVRMQEPQVAPGGVATFSFWMSVPNDKPAGTYREYFQLVADGATWMEDYGIYWDIKVPTRIESYHTDYINQNAFPPTLRPGQSYNFTVQFKNNGYTTWQKGVVNLGTDRDRDRIPGFIREDLVGNNSSGWISPNRVTMAQNSVAPGETGTFSFWYTVPADKGPGAYREYFRLVADGITWMEDYGVYWDIRIQ